jgi:hypothetical protein
MKREDIFQEITIDTVNDLNYSLDNRSPQISIRDKYIFRGEYEDYFQLIPKSLREYEYENIIRLGKVFGEKKKTTYEQYYAEYNILKGFYNLCDLNGIELPEITEYRNTIERDYIPNYKFNFQYWLPQELWEIAGLAQHYGLPTRLLDWTYDVNVALFFAVNDTLKKSNSSKYMVLYLLNTLYFEIIRIQSIFSPVVLIRPAYSRNSNLYAQKGLFTLWQESISSNLHENPVDKETFDKKIIGMMESIEFSPSLYSSGKVLYKFKINKQITMQLKDTLKSNGYTTASIFPGMNGIVECMKNGF